jgi:hypothetical protein
MRYIVFYILFLLINCSADRPYYKNSRNPINPIQSAESTDEIFKKNNKDLPFYVYSEESSPQKINELWNFSSKYPSTKLKSK